ncbi:DUF2505 domain-containing protein [Mycolicibacterium porcinum]|uniref:DUF2505 domain-containing protein n=1 Tax=Mycolicibacterium porcinum TaxID=39693 RepID=UPI000B2B4582|nr:DUF2505 domain-containing protein [Mycolicibacterium porcinum]
MSRRLEYTLAFDAPAEAVYAGYASDEYWQALMDRYDELTPGKSDITEFRSDGRGIEVEFRQVLPRAELPAILRPVIPLDMAITRRQCFGPLERHGASGHYTASVAHVPGRLDGRFELSGVSSGSRLRVESTCKVSMPLIGGKLEDMVLHTVNDVFTVEEAFTADWIAEHV